MVPPRTRRNRSKKCIYLIWPKWIKTHYLALKTLFELRHWSPLLILECVNHRLLSLVIRSSTAEYPWRTVQVTGAEKKKKQPISSHHTSLTQHPERGHYPDGKVWRQLWLLPLFSRHVFPYMFCIFSAAAIWDRMNSGLDKLQLNNSRAFWKLLTEWTWTFFLQTLFWVFLLLWKTPSLFT